MLQTLKNLFHLAKAILVAFYYRYPSRKLTVIGVTGTDGKTTTVNLIYHLLTAAGVKTAVLSTISSAHTTTPDSAKLQKFFSQSLKNHCSHAVIEVSSHAIDQRRIWGIDFSIGVLTNIATHEHLDYHRTFARYRDTKIKFLLSCPTIVANADDPSYEYLRSKINPPTGGQKLKLISYGIKTDADVTPQKFSFETKLLGEFNTYNILAAVATARTLGIDDSDIREAITTFSPPPGRLEIVVRKPFTVIVDFAHTPQAFEKVLPVARGLLKKKNSKLIHVFGATGNRDKSKRPIMAEIAAKYDDYIFLTHEDTYSEDPKIIISQLEMGLVRRGYTNYEKVYDRRETITKALSLAKPGDVVFLTGVGHQKSMNIGGREVPWSEQKVVKEILENARKK